jgi:sarcosine oxidase delta subunit
VWYVFVLPLTKSASFWRRWRRCGVILVLFPSHCWQLSIFAWLHYLYPRACSVITVEGSRTMTPTSASHPYKAKLFCKNVRRENSVRNEWRWSTGCKRWWIVVAHQTATIASLSGPMSFRSTAAAIRTTATTLWSDTQETQCFGVVLSSQHFLSCAWLLGDSGRRLFKSQEENLELIASLF